MATSVNRSTSDEGIRKMIKPKMESMIVNLEHGYFADFGDVLRGGTVYRGSHSNKKHLAIVAKQLKSKRDADVEKQKIDLVLKTFLISHQNIVSVLNHFIVNGRKTPNCWIISEYCDGNDLFTFIKHNCGGNPLGHKVATDIMNGCAEALTFLHSQVPPLLHRNIHPRNILVKKEQSRNVVKMDDCLMYEAFGGHLNKGPLTANTQSGQVYRQCYHPPEAVQTGGIPVDSKAYDVFCLGAVFHAMLSYKPDSLQNASNLLPCLPESLKMSIPDRHLLANYISDCEKDDKQPTLFDPIEERPPLQGMITNMLHYEPSKRLSAAQVLKKLYTIGEIKDQLPIHYKIESTVGDHNQSKQMVSEAGKHKVYDVLTGENDQERLEKLVDDFEDALGTFAPECVQHFDASVKYYRINVSVDKGQEQEADQYFKIKHPNYYKYIHLVPQTSKPKFLCGNLPGVKRSVEAGSPLLCAPPGRAAAIEDGREKLKDIIESGSGEGSTFFTLGCYADGTFADGSKLSYAVTAKHPVDYAEGEISTTHNSIISAYRDQQIDVPITISQQHINEVIGVNRNVSINGVNRLADIAICELSADFINSGKTFWLIRNAPWLPNRVPVPVLRRLNDDLLQGTKVRKQGAQTGHTAGVVVRDNKRTRVGARFRFGKGTFLVQSNQQGGIFADGGDSGALLLDHMHDANSWALGLVCQSQHDYQEADTGCQADVTFCVRLNHSFEAIKQYRGINLNIVND